MRLTLAIIGQTMFSADVETEAAEIGEALTTVLAMFNLLNWPRPCAPYPPTESMSTRPSKLNSPALPCSDEASTTAFSR